MTKKKSLKLDKDEMDELLKAITKAANIYKPLITQHNPQLVNNSGWPMPSGTHAYNPAYGYPGISPTDVDAKGIYGYQEPEVDEQGTFYGYKILHKHCPRPDCDLLISPRYPTEWKDGELQADNVPDGYTMFGIHCTKRSNHSELKQYCSTRYWVLVKCALSGTIVETEQGFRAEHAQIIGVYSYGHWQSYQNYQERASAYSRPVTDPWREEERRRWIEGEWGNSYTLDDPNP